MIAYIVWYKDRNITISNQQWIEALLSRECVARTSAQCWDTYINAPARNKYAIENGWRTTRKIKLIRI